MINVVDTTMIYHLAMLHLAAFNQQMFLLLFRAIKEYGSMSLYTKSLLLLR